MSYTFTINSKAATPAGSDVFLRMKGPLPNVPIVVENVVISELASARRAIQISAEQASEVIVRNVHIGPMTLSPTALAAKFHGDGIQVNGGNGQDVTIEDVAIEGTGDGVSPIHIVDGVKFGTVTLRRVRIANYTTPPVIGSKATIAKLVIEDCPGLSIGKGGGTTPLPSVEWRGNNAGASYCGAKPPQPAPSIPAEPMVQKALYDAAVQRAVMAEAQVQALAARIDRYKIEVANLGTLLQRMQGI